MRIAYLAAFVQLGICNLRSSLLTSFQPSETRLVLLYFQLMTSRYPFRRLFRVYLALSIVSVTQP